MAVEEEEVEYESDPEDAPLPSMRRREASDDEDGEGSNGGGAAQKDPRTGIGSEGDSDGQGGAEVYDDEDDFEEKELDDEMEGDEEEAEYGEGVGVGVGIGVEGGIHGDVREGLELTGERSDGKQIDDQGKDQVEEEKKENEPYDVPTSGAFYMHDDRFQENGRGRHRRMFGGRKLWDSKDEHAWIHDRFEEMNLQDPYPDEVSSLERRRSKGRFRGGGGSRTHGTGHEYSRGRSRYRTYYDDGNNQNRATKTVRGRGPRRYEPLTKNNHKIPTAQQKQSTKRQEPTSNPNAGKQPSQIQNVLPEPVLPRKNTFASSLNSASPPFYPFGLSSQELSVAQKRDAQNGNTNKIVSPSAQLNDSLQRGKAIVDSVGHDSFYVDDSLRPAGVKIMGGSPLYSSGFTLSSTRGGQSSSNSRQGRSVSIGGSPNNKSLRSQVPIVQKRPVRPPIQPASRNPTQQFSQRSDCGNQKSSPSQLLSTSLAVDEEADSLVGTNKSKIPLAGKGEISIQGTGKGSFLYSGAQIIGDQGFPGTPALLPVMQFGGQHRGVPTVGMALPGYVAQPQHGFGNSEMSWVPVLARAARALGASYCPPYLALDSSYFTRPSGQTSSSVSSRESNTTKAGGLFRPLERPDVVVEGFEQRQNKPTRRYSEMNFGQ